MKVQTIIDKLNLKVLTPEKNFNEIEVANGYTSDLLSCVMAGAKNKSVWITLQSHGNIVAVAALLELSAIIITEGAMPDENTINKASEENIILLSSQEPSFSINGKLWEMGIRD
jgi:serine kinase of HPr protein (carbohydrate metabolism regulator)